MSTDVLELSLDDADPETRRRAVLAAASHGSTRELGALLLRALGDSDWRVRKEAVQLAIVRAEELALISPLVSAICQGENVGLRNAALDVLEALGDVAAPALIAALPGVPEHARKFVVEALGESGGEEVVEELGKAALSDDVNVAGEAIEALAHIGGAAAERVIRGRLQAKEPFLRLAALDALNRRDAVIEWEQLAPLLEERLLRRVTLVALGRTSSEQALPPLLHALEDASLQVVAAASLALVRLLPTLDAQGEPATTGLLALSAKARTALRGMFESECEVETRRAASELLVHARDLDALSGVVTQLARETPSPQLARSLRAWGPAAVSPLLALARRFENSQERAVALELAADLALEEASSGSRSAAAAQAALREALQDEAAVVVCAALRCFNQWAQPEDAQALLAHTLSQDSVVARTAAGALEALAQREPETVERALAGVNLDGPQGAVLSPVVATLGGSRALDLLQVLMSVDDSEVRRAALLGLGRVGGERAAGLVALALADEDIEVQIVAAQVLGRVRDESGGSPGMEGLVHAAASEFPQVRAAAARALGQTESPQAADALLALVCDADAGVAIAAVDALGQLHPEALAQRLDGALAHADPEVVKTALSALSDCMDPAAPERLVAALEHPAWDVRQLSGELLGELSVVHAKDALQRALARESDDLAREALVQALEKLEGRS